MSQIVGTDIAGLLMEFPLEPHEQGDAAWMIHGPRTPPEEGWGFMSAWDGLPVLHLPGHLA
jgi:hypothetical protein